MKISSMLFTMAAALCASLAITSCGGTLNQEQTSKYSPGLKLMFIGRTYVLQSVVYQTSSGTNYFAAAHPGQQVTLTIDSDSTVAGMMFCNSYSAKVMWGSDNYVVPSNYNIGNNVCQGAPANPFSFGNGKMYFNFGTSQLDLYDFAGTFHATFVLQ